MSTTEELTNDANKPTTGFPQIMYCTECGSTAMRCDGFAEQCEDGSWELVTTYDKDVWCADCEAENAYDFKDRETSEAVDAAPTNPPESRPA